MRVHPELVTESSLVDVVRDYARTTQVGGDDAGRKRREAVTAKEGC